MPEDNEKTLPKDFGSDYSLPGRFEEGNSEYFDVEPISSKPKKQGNFSNYSSFCDYLIWILFILFYKPKRD